MIITQLFKIVNTFYAVFTKITKQQKPFYEFFSLHRLIASKKIFISFILSIFGKENLSTFMEY